MPDETRPEALTEEDLSAVAAEPLPTREVMSVVAPDMQPLPDPMIDAFDEPPVPPVD